MVACVSPPGFDFDSFSAMFPEFAGITAGMANGYFLRATLQFGNDSTNPAFRDGNQTALLYLLTAHIAWISAPRDVNGNPSSTGTAPSPIVGRISSASEGSVSVSSEFNTSGSPSEAYYAQSRYGLEFWQATAKYRTARYMAHPTVVLPRAPSRYWGGRRW